MNRTLTTVLLGMAALVLFASAFVEFRPRERFIDTSGREEPATDALYLNGYTIANHGDATIKDAYLRYDWLLGEPISGFDGQRQTFRGGRLAYRPGNAPDWRVEFDSLGEIDLQVEGFTPRPHASPHPALRDFLRSQLELGIDILRVYGPTISDPVCRAGLCRQWTAKAAFEFEQAAPSGEAVRRLPIGLWLVYPATRATPTTGGVNAAPLVGAILLLGLIAQAQLRGSGAGRSRATTI